MGGLIERRCGGGGLVSVVVVWDRGSAMEDCRGVRGHSVGEDLIPVEVLCSVYVQARWWYVPEKYSQGFYGGEIGPYSVLQKVRVKVVRVWVGLWLFVRQCRQGEVCCFTVWVHWAVGCIGQGGSEQVKGAQGSGQSLVHRDTGQVGKGTVLEGVLAVVDWVWCWPERSSTGGANTGVVRGVREGG